MLVLFFTMPRCQVEGCNRGFDSAPRLRRHMKIHNKGYVCSVPGCAETFDKFSKLAIHVRSHGFVCEVCKKTFSRTWELKRHARLHSSDRKMYECPREGCSRVYSKVFNLSERLQLFRERLSEKAHVTIPKSNCGWSNLVPQVSLKQHMILHSQNKINLKAPSRGQSAQKKKSKKKRRPVSLAKKLSGYRSSSLSESSDTHTSEAGSRRRKSNTTFSRNVEESTTSLPSINAANSHEGPITTAVNMDLPEEVQVDSSSVPSGSVRLSDTPAVDKQHGTSSDLSSNLVPAVLTEEMGESHSVAALSKRAPANMGTKTVTNSNSSQRVYVENTPAANDDFSCTFSSSDEEGMDWEPTGCNAFTEVDSENETERMENHAVSSHNCSANELDSDDGRLVIDSDALAEVDSENEIEKMEKGATRSQNSASELESDDGRLVIDFGGSSSNAVSQLPSMLSSVNSKESNKNTPAANDDFSCTFSSSDEEGMDWEPTGCNAFTEVDSENETERMENHAVSSHNCSANELDSDDGRLVIDSDALAEVDSENEIEKMEKGATRSQNSASELESDDGRLVIDFGGSSSNAVSQLPSMLSSVNSKESNKVIDSSQRNRDAASVTQVSSLVNKADISAKKKHKSKKRKRKEKKKSRHDESKAECESTDFPGLDDVLQVIIEEESQISDQIETRSESDPLHLEHDDISNNRSIRTEKRVTSLDEEETSVENHTLRRPYQEEITEEIHNGVHQARIVSNIPSSTTSEEGSLPIEQDFVEYDSVVDLGNDDDISSDENVINISKQTISPHVDGSPIAQVARDNETGQVGFSRGSTPESMGNSPDVSLDNGEVSRDEAATSPASQSLEETTENKGKEDKISNNAELTRPRLQCPNKRTIQKNERNVRSKTSNNRSSLIPAKHTATNAAKSNNSEVEDINVGLNNSETVSNKTSQKNVEHEDSQSEFSVPKFRSRANIFTCDLQTLELLWNFKGK
ncbi:unnamed protein product [Porites evermanni]|uniref:C2H2-type domain-containing protein n=1 Tax=Porites evermanni TaxID=104178 RepID=A0ABN8QQP9_9CNID|nr:unnamed protein product [Porites evermanni]